MPARRRESVPTCLENPLLFRAARTSQRGVSLQRIALVDLDQRMSSLEHDPEKWKPVFRKDHAQTKS